MGNGENLKQRLGPVQVTQCPAVLGIREMPKGAWHCTEVYARSHLLDSCVFQVGFSSSFPHSITYLTFWPPERAPLPLDESASALADAKTNQDGGCESQGEAQCQACNPGQLQTEGCSWESLDCFMIRDAETFNRKDSVLLLKKN